MPKCINYQRTRRASRLSPVNTAWLRDFYHRLRSSGLLNFGTRCLMPNSQLGIVCSQKRTLAEIRIERMILKCKIINF